MWGVHGPATDDIQRVDVQLGKQVGQHHADRDGFEGGNRQVTECQGPADQEGLVGPEGTVGVGHLAPGDRQHRGQFRVAGADQDHQQAAGSEGQHRAGGAGVLKPVAQGGDPADSDHRSERQRQESQSADGPFQAGTRQGLAAHVRSACWQERETRRWPASGQVTGSGSVSSETGPTRAVRTVQRLARRGRSGGGG